MSCHGSHELLTHRDESIVLFVDVEVLDYALSQEVLKVFQAQRQVLDVSLSQFGSTFLDNDEWADESASISGDVDTVQLLVVVN